MFYSTGNAWVYNIFFSEHIPNTADYNFPKWTFTDNYLYDPVLTFASGLINKKHTFYINTRENPPIKNVIPDVPNTQNTTDVSNTANVNTTNTNAANTNVNWN